MSKPRVKAVALPSRSRHASLTESICSRIRPAESAVVDFYDTRLANLSLRVSPPSKVHSRGLLVWRFGYRHNGSAGIITIGRYPTWSSDAALRKARKLQVMIDEGLNPREVLRQQAPAPAAVALPPADTTKKMFERYESELDTKSGNHRRNVASYFARFILPAWGDRDIHSLTRREIVDLLKVVKDKSGPIAANRCGTAISTWLNWLVGQGVLEASPARALPRSEEQPREQTLTVPQLVKVWRAAERLGGPAGNPAGQFVRLLIALPVRRDEASALPRSEIDGDTWLLPAGRNKSGRDFLIPLNSLAQDILRACPDTGLYLFTTSGKRPISGFARLKAKLDAVIAEMPGEPLPAWRFHDIRRSVRTALSGLGVDPDIAERLLNHSMGRLRGTYDRHQYRPEKAKALQLWAEHFTAALAASNPAEPEARAAAD